MGGTWARTGLPQSVSTTSYNAGNQQLTFDDKTLTYDNNGNLTDITDASGTTLYSWNARNQLTGIGGPSVSASFVYDGSGRREQKTVTGSLTEFLFDGVNPVQEISGANVLANILSSPSIDEYLMRTDIISGITSDFLPDALGSVLALTDTAGVVRTEYTYEPFGQSTITGDPNSNPFQFSGRENDNTGLYYYRARYYYPPIQRFITEDPVLSASNPDIYMVPTFRIAPALLHAYAYVTNNPLNFKDPSGTVEVPALLKWWGCNHTPEECCKLDYTECLRKLDLITCPESDIQKCYNTYLLCMAKTGIKKEIGK